ncbi:UDP-glucuronosyltransferase 2B9-like isoform X2 [Formica exsecta]|uniref:UDP-glucuronosyltransferase 2B9-like isoform X2 n=1 Tax=Formica exsecta TaxID=72781 RepID=UPI001142CA6A|nr:UDP-glucuronosyltransferase 2B9-like isoform X2 [Formica exsecta]
MGPIAKMIFWMMCFLCIVTPFLEAARILAIISLPSYSHQVAYQLLWTTLSRRGHELVVLTTDPVNDPSITNLTEIDFHYNYKEIKSASFVKTMEQSRWINLERNQFFNISHVLTENIYKHSEVRKMYAPDSDQKFDAVIIEIIKTPGLYSLAHRFNAPLIGISSVKLYNYDYYLLGAPVLPSHPSSWEMGKATGFNLSFWERLNNFIQLWYYIYYVLNHFFAEQQAIAEKYLGKNIPDIRDIEKNMSIVLQNEQEAISFIRPTMSNIITFGNSHILKQPPALPKDLNKFLADAPNGFIYMSLGTNIAHPKIRLFIYQGGLQSTEEAVYNTVPLIGIPVIADQYYNVKKMVSLGVAKELIFQNISREIVNASIIDILNDKRYKERMLKLKAMNEDKPNNLLENAIWWIEFVIRHKDVSHFRCSIAYDPWYQRYDMDIIAVLSIAIFVILFCTLVIIYKLLKIIFNCNTKKQVNVTKKNN